MLYKQSYIKLWGVLYSNDRLLKQLDSATNKFDKDDTGGVAADPIRLYQLNWKLMEQVEAW